MVLKRRGGPSRRYAKRKSVRGRKGVGRRRQSVRQAKQGLPKRQVLQSNLGGLTMTRFTASNRPSTVASFIKKTGAPNFINITYPGVISCAGGSQTNSSWYLNTAGDLRRIWASIQAQYTSKRAATGAEYVSVTSGGLGTTDASFRFVLESAISQLNLANTSGTPVNMELYDIVAKRDSPQIPLDMSGNIVYFGGKFGQSTNLLDPGVAWVLGMKNQSYSATGFQNDGSTYELPSPENLGATPYQSKLFKDYFKVVRKTNVSLPIGGQHKHFVDLKPNVVIDNDMMTQNNAFKGLSFFTLIVASGVPVVKCPDLNPLDVLRNPFGDATTSAVSVSVIQQIKYKWTWVQDARENIYRANYINNQNVAAAQSIQPAMTKINYADIPILQTTSDGVLVDLPSECTRLDASGNLVVGKADCGC